MWDVGWSKRYPIIYTKSNTNNTLSLLKAAADDNTKREEEDGRDDTTGAEVILNISTTVGTAVPEKENN